VKFSPEITRNLLSGKSTFLKIFQSNISFGNIFFGNINRINISFEDLHMLIFNVYQASEYMPIFSKNEIESYQGKDLWLEQQLGLEKLFKNSTEISGGQKKRMLLYLTLVSNCPILLLDEILSELSTEETPEVPEGGGWLTRVINTIVYWKGRNSKIIILVGHGLIESIPNENTVFKLKINEINKKTILVPI
jgi:ABC-type lipoprotein export system ATPase subunit